MLAAILIVSLSTITQAAAGLLALRLIPVTRHRLAWTLVALGLCGMALRRAMSLYGALAQGGAPVMFAMPFELLGLATSCCMLWGVALVRPLFDAAHRARQAAERIAEEKTALARELQQAMDNIKVLHGILPTCAWCKQIRDEAGQWHPIEEYVRTRSEAEFSHGICPECMKRLYPQYAPPESLDTQN